MALRLYYRFIWHHREHRDARAQTTRLAILQSAETLFLLPLFELVARLDIFIGKQAIYTRQYCIVRPMRIAEQ